MALVLRPPSDKSLQIQQDYSRDGFSYSLSSKDSEQKAFAIKELAAKGKSALANHLDTIVAQMRHHPTDSVKQAVCQAIVSAGPTASPFYEDVLTLLNEHSAEVRYWACLALGAMGSRASGSKSHLRRLLEDRSEAVRFGACSALGDLQATDCIEELEPMLMDTSPEVQGAACVALGKLGISGSSCASMVVQKLNEPRSRPSAIRALGLMGAEGGRHLKAICDCLGDSDPETRILAASVVGKLADFVTEAPEAMSQIVGLVSDEDGRKRLAALLALGYLGKEAAEQKDLIKDLLLDNFEEPAENCLTVGGCRVRLPPSCRKVKCAAAAALGRIAAEDDGFGWELPATEIARLLDDNDWEVKLCALDALASLGERARPHAAKVVRLFRDEKYILRVKAAETYGKLRDIDLISGLADLLEDYCPSVKVAAAQALSELGEEGAEFADKVFCLVHDFTPEVRVAAITALSQIGPKGQIFASSIAQKVSDPEDPTVRIAAIKALASMEERGATFIDVISNQLQDPLDSVRAAASSSVNTIMARSHNYSTEVQALCSGINTQAALQDR